MGKNIDALLEKLSMDYFEAINLSAARKREIFSQIRKDLSVNREHLLALILKEIKLTEKDAEKEIDRAYYTFQLAEENADFIKDRRLIRNGKEIIERRLARGPLLAITPFSSPLSSPAHKIALGILVGTSVLFKPSPLANKTGRALFDIINLATNGKYVYFINSNDERELKKIVSDNRIGIISFTGGYKTGEKIIKAGGIKKYHMELVGGNSLVIFTPDYDMYNSQLLGKVLDGIVAKNGQRCVSIKHIFIPAEHKDFIIKLQNVFISLKKEIHKDFLNGKRNILGTLITSEYAQQSETKIRAILRYLKDFTTLVELERENDYLLPSLYVVHKITKNLVRHNLQYDLPGPIVLVYFYNKRLEYKQILDALKNDYLQSGLQLSVFTNNRLLIKEISKNLIWGGIIVNDIPTYRDEFMSFGGFGKAGLGKEGFFETVYAYTDPRVIVYNNFIENK